MVNRVVIFTWSFFAITAAHYSCPESFYDGVENTVVCVKYKTEVDKNCISEASINVKLISKSGKFNAVLCDNETRPAIGSCWCEETSGIKTCTARLLGNREWDGGNVVFSFCLGSQDVDTDGCKVSYSNSRNLATRSSPQLLTVSVISILTYLFPMIHDAAL